jgi:hypothetical protein
VSIQKILQIVGYAIIASLLFAFWSYLTDFRHPLLAAGLAIVNGLTLVIGWAAESAFSRWRARRQIRILDRKTAVESSAHVSQSGAQRSESPRTLAFSSKAPQMTHPRISQ